jgi:hypothetical protein
MKTFTTYRFAGILLGLAMWAGALPLLAGEVVPRRTFLNLPLYFEPADPAGTGEFQFVARGQSRSVQLSAQRAVVSLQRVNRPESGRRGLAAEATVSGHTVAFDFIGANPHARMVGEAMLPGQINYFLGNQPAAWRRAITPFARVRAGEVYPGVDLVYYGNQERLEYDFILQPGADPDRIAFRITGADGVRVDAAGELVLTLGREEIRQLRPVAYQTIRGVRREVAAGYRLHGHTVSFALGDYDRTQPLVIDPILRYVTFFNGSGSDVAWDVAVQNGGTNGFLFVAGETLSANLPATPGAFSNQLAGVSSIGGDAFVAKLDLGLFSSNLVYLTYLGGVSHDGAFSLATDESGNAYLTGYTASTNFPIVGNLCTNLNGGVRTTPTLQQIDAFVTKLSPDGSSLIYSTFLGGEDVDEGFGISVDAAGAAYVTGFTQSTNFPLANLAVTNRGFGSDVFVTRINPDGQSFGYSLQFGGSDTDRGEGIIVDAAGQAFVAGFTRSADFPITTNIAFQVNHNTLTNLTALADAFLLRVSPAGEVAYASYLGGTRDDLGFNVTLDAVGNVYVCGSTTSTNFVDTAPGIPGGVLTNSAIADVFVTKFDPSLTNLVYSVVFGGTAKDEAWDVAVDALGRAYLVGDSFSLGMPVTNYQGFLSATNAGSSDAFLGRLNAAGTALDYLGYLGGKSGDLAYALKLDAGGNVYFVGQTASANFPGAPALGGTSDGFVAKVFDVPVLEIAAAAGEVSLSWPAFAPELILQSTRNLPATNFWELVVAAPPVIGNRHTVTLSPTNAATFFRLVKP